MILSTRGSPRDLDYSKYLYCHCVYHERATIYFLYTRPKKSADPYSVRCSALNRGFSAFPAAAAFPHINSSCHFNSPCAHQQWRL